MSQLLTRRIYLGQMLKLCYSHQLFVCKVQTQAFESACQRFVSQRRIIADLFLKVHTEHFINAYLSLLVDSVTKARPVSWKVFLFMVKILSLYKGLFDVFESLVGNSMG